LQRETAFLLLLGSHFPKSHRSAMKNKISEYISLCLHISRNIRICGIFLCQSKFVNREKDFELIKL